VKQNITRLQESFDKLAADYDEITADFAHFVCEYVTKANLGDFLKRHTFSHILEAGAGTGKWTAFLHSFCRDVTLLDISGESLKIAAQKHKRLPLRIIRGNIEETDFSDNEFDFICAEGGVISYTPGPVRMIKEIHRVLKENGYAWIDFYNSLGWAFEYHGIDFKIETALADERLIRMPDWDYPARTFLPHHLAGLLTEHGFAITGFFANGILLNSFSIKEKEATGFDREQAEKLREIELWLSREAGYYNSSLACRFLVKKTAGN